MKRYHIVPALAAAALAAALVSQAQAATNLVQNPSFEAGPTIWALNGAFAVYNLPANAYDGNKYLEVKNGYATFDQNIPTETGATYQLGFFVRADDGPHSILAQLDGYTVYDHTWDPGNNNFDYVEYTSPDVASFVATDSSTTLHFNAYANGLIRFDLISLVKTADAPNPEPSSVPVPAAAWMGGSMLSGLGLLRLRRRA